jgi:hypothetical protein
MVDLYKLDLGQHLERTERYYYLVRRAKRCKATVRPIPCPIQCLLISYQKRSTTARRQGISNNLLL